MSTFRTNTNVILTTKDDMLLTSKGNVLAIPAMEGMRPVRASDIARRGYLGDHAYIIRPTQVGEPCEEAAKAGAKVTRLEDITPIREWVVSTVAMLAEAWAHDTCEGGLPYGEAWSQVIRMPVAAKGLNPSHKEFKLGMNQAGWFQSRGFFTRKP